MELLPASAWPDVAPVWRELAESCPGTSFFLGAKWVETWLTVFAPVLDVSISLFGDAVEPVAACLLVNSTMRRSGIPWQRISINTAGEAARDTTFVEYNNLLCREGWETAVAGTIADYLKVQNPDEISLDGFCPGPAYEALKLALRDFHLEESWQSSWFVELDRMRTSVSGLESALGHTTRKHLRQNISHYSRLGPLNLEPADNTQTALAMFDEMAQLNLRRWKGRSAYPVFASPRFREFHRALIANSIADGSVELMRLSAGGKTIGILYHLVHNGTVSLYQTGLNYAIDPRLSPGTVTIFHGIQRAFDSGAVCFDFLAGSEPYKERMSTASRRLVWAAFRKPGSKLRVYLLAKAVRGLLRSSIQGYPESNMKP